VLDFVISVPLGTRVRMIEPAMRCAMTAMGKEDSGKDELFTGFAGCHHGEPISPGEAKLVTDKPGQ